MYAIRSYYGFNSDTIKRFFHRFYQPERIVVSVAGNLKHNQFLDIAGPVFESVQPGNDYSERITPDEHCKVEIHYKDLEQVHICLATNGMSITDPRRYAYSLLNTIRNNFV